MNEHLVFSIVLIILGLFAIVTSATDWNYFFSHRKAQYLVNFLGRQGARIFYLILGIAIFFVGLLSWMGKIKM